MRHFLKTSQVEPIVVFVNYNWLLLSFSTVVRSRCFQLAFGGIETEYFIEEGELHTLVVGKMLEILI